LLFYQNFFVPAALYFVYKEIHDSNCDDERDLLNDLFSLGSGARTQDLLPEITVACQACDTNFSLGQESVEILNMKVFNQQIADGFFVDGLITSESDISDSSLASKTSLSDDESAFNPFATSNISDITSLQVEKVLGFVCSLCPKKFTKQDFLEYHKSVFHKKETNGQESCLNDLHNDSEKVANNVKVVRPCFVDDKDPYLMTTFVDESSPLIPDIEEDITCAAGQDGGQKNTACLEERSRRGVRKILKYPKC
jgi:hypothetical protein